MTAENMVDENQPNETDNTLEESIGNDFQAFVHKLLSNEKIVNRNVLQEYHVEKGVNLSEILSRLASCIPTSEKKILSPDTYNHISILSQSLQGYLRIVDTEPREILCEKVNLDTTKWLSNLYGLENMFSHYHTKEWEGLVKVGKLALHTRYAKYATDGFTALYTRPPVIYLSAAAPPEFGKRLRSELGLPQSSICTVPCNTMFGSPYTMDVAAFERLLTDDVSCGKTPLILIAYAGTPVSGHTDNLSALREICTQSGVWFHVEGDTLANLTMSQVQPSIQAATTADSLTLNFSKWYGISTLPFCTFYQTNNISMAHSSGLIPEFDSMLIALPLWLIIQFMGTHDLKCITEHASGLSQQMSNRLDLINSVKRIEQPTGLSPVVIFKYKASVALAVASKDSADNTKKSLIAQGVKIDASPKLCDEYNSNLAYYLKSISEKVVVNKITIPHDGTCIKFNPLQTSRTSNTSKDDVNDFVEMLQSKVIQMDFTLINRNTFQNLLLCIPDVVPIDVSEEALLGAFQAIPTYWKDKTMSNLSDSKKEEANELNLKLFGELIGAYKCVAKRILSTGQICIVVGLIDETMDLNLFFEKISIAAVELQDNTKFVDSVKDTVEQSIKEAQAKLDQERDERLYQEGIIRNVPIVSSLYNWWSPMPEDEHGIIGQSFDLSSGRLEMTDKVYKYKLQVCDDQSDSASEISRKSINPNEQELEEIDNLCNGDDESVSGDSIQTLSDVELAVDEIAAQKKIIQINAETENVEALVA